MRACLLFALLFLLAACAAQPTALLPTATSTPAPTHTPTLTPSPTLTPTPTPLPHPAAFDTAFERGLIRYDAASGQWLVSAVQSVDGGRQTADFILLPDSFATHDDLRAHNPLAPYTVRAISPLPAGEGPGVREVTLLWNAEKAEFRLAYEIPNVQQLLESGMSVEEIESLIPVVSPEDFTDGTVIQSVLLAMQRDGYQPFSQSAFENYEFLSQNNLGHRLHFELEDDLKTVSLHTANIFADAQPYIKKGFPQTIAPYFLYLKLGDKKLPVITVPTINGNGEFINLFGVPYFISRSGVEEIPSFDSNYIPRLLSAYLRRVRLYAERTDGQPLDPNSPNLVESLLSQLLSIEGNDALTLPSEGDGQYYYAISDIIKGNINSFTNVAEILDHYPLPPQLQQMILPGVEVEK